MLLPLYKAHLGRLHIGGMLQRIQSDALVNIEGVGVGFSKFQQTVSLGVLGGSLHQFTFVELAPHFVAQLAFLFFTLVAAGCKAQDGKEQ